MAVGALASIQNTLGVRSTLSVSGKRPPDYMERIDRIVSAPNIPNDEKLEMLGVMKKGYRNAALEGIVLTGFSAMGTAMSVAAVVAGIPVGLPLAVLFGYYTFLAGRETREKFRASAYAEEAMKKLAPQQSPIPQPSSHAAAP